MNKRRALTILTSLLLGIGYVSVLLQWLWLLIIALPPIIESGAFESFGKPSTSDTPIIQAPAIEMSPVGLWLMVGITVAILLTTAIVLIRLPRTILRTSERVVHQVTDAVIPVVTHHVPLPAKKRLILSRRVRLLIQLTAAVVPGIACLFVPPIEELTSQIILTIELGLMAVSIVAFVLAWATRPPQATSRTQSRVFRG